MMSSLDKHFGNPTVHSYLRSKNAFTNNFQNAAVIFTSTLTPKSLLRMLSYTISSISRSHRVNDFLLQWRTRLALMGTNLDQSE